MRTLRMILTSEDGKIEASTSITIGRHTWGDGLNVEVDSLVFQLDKLEKIRVLENPEYAKATSIGLVYHPEIVHHPDDVKTLL